MEGIHTIAASSSSTTYGNVASAMREMLISHFPYDFFKYINISTEAAFRNFRRQLGPNTDLEFAKRKKPYLIIRPNYNAPSGDMYLSEVPMTKNFNNVENGISQRHLLPIYKDKKQNFAIMYKLNRDRIDFDITITVSTLPQQIDIYKSMMNVFTWDNPVYLPTSLEAMLPRSLITTVGKMLGTDITDKTINKVPELLEQLNFNSQYPITYKMKNVSALDEFFMYYNHNILMTLSDLSLEEGTKKNMSDDTFNINFKIQADFNLPGLFALIGLPPSLNSELAIDIGDYGAGSNEFIPIYTYNNLFGEYVSKIDGFRLYTSSLFKTNRNQATGTDVLDISPIFTDEYIKIIKENNQYKVSVDTVTRLIILKNRTEISPTTDWSVDWNQMKITINNAEDDATYRILVYINSIKINDRIAEIMDGMKRDKSGL